jgi:hypothetical protein
MAEGVGRSGPIHIYSATPLCCASQTEVAEGLLLGEWPSPCKGYWAFVWARGVSYKYRVHQGLGRK